MKTIVSEIGLEAKTPPEIQAGVDTVEKKPAASLEPTPEQIRYAGLLEKGTHVGLACLLVTFPLYIFGIVEPHTPLEKVHECWALSAQEYHRKAGVEAGWSWVSMLGHGDFINFIGITILAGVTVVCYLGIIPLMLKRNDTIYAVLALLQVVVLVLAASGILAVGH